MTTTASFFRFLDRPPAAILIVAAPLAVLFAVAPNIAAAMLGAGVGQAVSPIFSVGMLGVGLFAKNSFQLVVAVIALACLHRYLFTSSLNDTAWPWEVLTLAGGTFVGVLLASISAAIAAVVRRRQV